MGFINVFVTIGVLYIRLLTRRLIDMQTLRWKRVPDRVVRKSQTARQVFIRLVLSSLRCQINAYVDDFCTAHSKSQYNGPDNYGVCSMLHALIAFNCKKKHGTPVLEYFCFSQHAWTSNSRVDETITITFSDMAISTNKPMSQWLNSKE